MASIQEAAKGHEFQRFNKVLQEVARPWGSELGLPYHPLSGLPQPCFIWEKNMTSRLQRLGEALKPHILKPHTIKFCSRCLRKCKRNSKSKKWLTYVQHVGTVCASEWHRKSVSEFQARLHAKALHRMPYELFSIKSTRWKDNARAILKNMVYL